MALIKCWECSKEISDTAKTCPHCGAIQNIRKRVIVKPNILKINLQKKINQIGFKNIVLMLSVLFGVIIFPICAYIYSEQDLNDKVLSELVWQIIAILGISGILILAAQAIMRIFKIKSNKRRIMAVIALLGAIGGIVTSIVYLGFMGLIDSGLDVYLFEYINSTFLFFDFVYLFQTLAIVSIFMGLIALFTSMLFYKTLENIRISSFISIAISALLILFSLVYLFDNDDLLINYNGIESKEFVLNHYRPLLFLTFLVGFFYLLFSINCLIKIFKNE